MIRISRIALLSKLPCQSFTIIENCIRDLSFRSRVQIPVKCRLPYICFPVVHDFRKDCPNSVRTVDSHRKWTVVCIKCTTRDLTEGRDITVLCLSLVVIKQSGIFKLIAIYPCQYTETELFYRNAAKSFQRKMFWVQVAIKLMEECLWMLRKLRS